MSIVDTRPPPDEKQGRKGGPPTRRWLVPAAVAAGALVLLLSPLWAPLLLRRLAFFQVRHVEIVGARYVEPRDVIARMRIDTLASVWDPTGPWRARAAAHPLIREVRVERKLPGTIVVRIAEHAPVALVPTTTGFKAYDERGVALPIDPAAADVDAPILLRPDTAVLRLLGGLRLGAPALYRRISEVRREGTSGGELRLSLGDLPVRALADVSLQRLADLAPVEQDLERRKLRVAELDLRYRDQVIARLQ